MADTNSDHKQDNIDDSTRYILITQCLQNDFFLTNQCKLRLPTKAVKNMLVGKGGPEIDEKNGESKLKLAKGYPADGPLGKFLSNLYGQRKDRSRLHIINIRDCHDSSVSYDKERRVYGAHCENNSEGADYIEGLEKLLDPGRLIENGQDGHKFKHFSNDKVNTYHVSSDSLFDFGMPADSSVSAEKRLKFKSSLLEDILDIIVSGNNEQVKQLSGLCKRDNSGEELKTIEELAIDANKNPQRKDRVYIAVIGVYTDIKIKILMTCLRTRYDIPNLALSDTLTASASMHRHLGALDFASKILNVEIIHGLENLVKFLGGVPAIEDEEKIIASERYLDYASYFQDKQNVLAYESEKLKDYLELTSKKSESVYKTIHLANQFLLIWGKVFLGVSLIGMVASAVYPKLDWKPFAYIGSAGLVQILTLVFYKPMSYVQKNLTNLAVFRMVLESHSLKTALARFHLTTPQVLREDADKDAYSKQVDSLNYQLGAMVALENDYNTLKNLGFGADKTDKAKEASGDSNGQD